MKKNGIKCSFSKLVNWASQPILQLISWMIVFGMANTHAGIIAHRKEDAEDIFKKKVKYAYDRMPHGQEHLTAQQMIESGELAFANGSSYRVSTGFRSGTYQRLLVSEFGKICSNLLMLQKKSLQDLLTLLALIKLLLLSLQLKEEKDTSMTSQKNLNLCHWPEENCHQCTTILLLPLVRRAWVQRI